MSLRCPTKWYARIISPAQRKTLSDWMWTFAHSQADIRWLLLFIRIIVFTSMISEWRKLGLKICDSPTLEIFNSFMAEVPIIQKLCPANQWTSFYMTDTFVHESKRVSQTSILKLHNPLEIKLPHHLRAGVSHLKEHKLKHNFQDSFDPLCSCGNSVESVTHSFLYHANYTSQQRTFFWKKYTSYWCKYIGTKRNFCY